jgi:NADP-dependent 3-hydroxy acid dehydrogenase YdfG
MTGFWPNAHALVTGAGSGIGAATAIALARAGVRVSIAGRRIDALKATAALLGQHAAVAVSIDATDEAAVTKGIAQIEA